jgi:hypothetical protein
MIDSEAIYEKKISIFNETTKFIIQKDKETFSIQKAPGLTITKEENPKIGASIKVHGIIGVIDTKINSYLLGISKASYVGNLLNNPIFKIEEVYCFLFI